MRAVFVVIASGLFAAVLNGQEKKTVYTDPYKFPVDTGKSEILAYPPLTEREGNGLIIPAPPNEHPRLLLRSRDIPLLKEKITNPMMVSCWEGIVQNAAYQTDGILQQEGVKHNMNNRVINSIEAKAFLYAFQNNREYGRNAVTAVINYNKTLKIDHEKADVCRDIGRVIFTTAIVYDWCYDLLGAQEKKALIVRMENLGKQLEILWPKLVQGSIVGHGSEAQLARDMLSCGVATYDEKPEIYKIAAGRIIAEFLPARKFFYPAGYQHQGSAYGPYRYQWDLWITMIFDRMGYPQILGPEQSLVPYRWIYSRRPDGQFFRDGDDFSELFTAFGRPWTIAGSAWTGSYFKDPVLMGEAVDKRQIGRDGLFDFLFIDPAVPAKSDLSDLPLSRYYKEPLGLMVARTGWNKEINSNIAIAEMKVGVYSFANHQHLDAGSFQVYYKGPLVMNSGIYQGKTGGYGCDHFINYYQRSIAHNTILVYDPDEKFAFYKQPISNDGGQKYPNGAAEPRNMTEFLKNDYKTGEVLAHGLGPDPVKPEFSYLKGEIAEAYSRKVKSIRRSYVFLNLNNTIVPAALIIFDRIISSNKDFKKTFLMHCAEEPSIEGIQTIIKRTEKGYNGKLLNTTLLPVAQNLNVRKIGGFGNEYNVNGINYPQSPPNDNNCADGAIWRLEISPQTASETDNFLNVMQVMDYSGENIKPFKTEMIETGKFVGAMLSDRITLFSKDGEINANSLSLKIISDGSFKVFIADLKDGRWKVGLKDEKKSTVYVVNNIDHVLYFKGGKGEYQISPE